MRARPATVEDLIEINAIYNYYVETSTCTFQLQPSRLEERLAWFEAHGDVHPVLVVDDAEERAAARGERVVGWASLSPWSARGGYARTVELSVYVRHDRRGQGIGRLLITALLERARELGHHVVVSGVSADQDASLSLHLALGFVEAGRLQEVGFKFGRWLDVVYLACVVEAPATRVLQ